MNRKNLQRFQKTKSLLKIDEINSVPSEIKKLYRDIHKDLIKQLIQLAQAEYNNAGGTKKTIDKDWLEEYIFGYNEVTKYLFENEWERKRQRLIEAIISCGTDKEIKDEMDKGLKILGIQIAQVSDDTTETARIDAFLELGITRVRWITQHDEKVCEECDARNNVIYPIDEVPSRHYHCRCYLLPVRD